MIFIYSHSYKFYNVSSENFEQDQSIILLLIFFPLLSSHVCLMLFWYCKEKFCLGHSWELTWLVTNQKFMSKPLMHWHVTSQNNLPRVPSLHQAMTTEEYWVHAGLHQELYSCLFLVVLQQEVQLSLIELIKIHCQ